MEKNNYQSGIYTDNPDDTLRYMHSCDAVDAVKVVRCINCKYRPTCGYISTKSVAERKIWFCADGEEDE